MEHIIQFGVNIDDDAIRREVVKLATREIIDDLKRECRKELGLTGNVYCPSEFVKKMVDEILADCRDQIVMEAADVLADKAPKQKWYREMMPSAVAERGER